MADTVKASNITDWDYWSAIHKAAARLARSAEIKALDPSASGGRNVYEDMRALRAAMEAKR